MIHDRREFFKKLSGMLAIPYFYGFNGQNPLYMYNISEIEPRYHQGRRLELEPYVANVGYVSCVEGKDYAQWFIVPPFYFKTYVSNGDEYILRIELTDNLKKTKKNYLMGQIKGKDKDVLGMISSYAQKLKEKGGRIHIEGIYNLPDILNIEFIYTDPRSSKSGIINTSLSLEGIIQSLGGWNHIENTYPYLIEHFKGRHKIYFEK